MTSPDTRTETPDPWETGDLGRDDAYVERVVPEVQKEIEESLELQMISIRLQKSLLADLKFIADFRGMGYQPLIREAMGRFARAEMSFIARELHQEKQDRKAIAEATPVNPPNNVKRA